MEVIDRRHSWFRLTAGTLLAGAIVLFFSSCSNFLNFSGGAGDFDTVVIDPGHGGFDLGALAIKGSPEKVLTLDTANRVSAILRAAGFHVIQTRTGDYFVPLGNRTAIANRESNAIFVSIHYNWAPRHAPHGFETYYYNPRARRLAANILAKLHSAYPTLARGVKYDAYYVLHHNKRPAVLCELGFVSNPTDDRFVQNPAVRQRIAEAIAAGIIAERNGHSP